MDDMALEPDITLTLQSCEHMEFDLTEPLYVKIIQYANDADDKFCPDGVRVYMNDQTEIGGPSYSQNEGKRKNLE